MVVGDAIGLRNLLQVVETGKIARQLGLSALSARGTIGR